MVFHFKRINVSGLLFLCLPCILCDYSANYCACVLICEFSFCFICDCLCACAMSFCACYVYCVIIWLITMFVCFFLFFRSQAAFFF